MDSHRASLSTQIFYGSGSISIGIKNNLLGTYLLIYYNQVLGLDAGIAALAMAIALVSDLTREDHPSCLIRKKKKFVGWEFLQYTV